MLHYNYAEEIIKHHYLSLAKNKHINFNIPKDEMLNAPAGDSILKVIL